LIVAFLSYLLLHRLAVAPLSPATPGRVGDMLVPVVIRGLAHVGQYLIPVLCAASAGISAHRRRTRGKLLADVAARRAAEPFVDLTWQQFEQVIGEMFRKQGYQAEESGGGGADGGVDLVLRRGGERHPVQCKHWRAYKVGVETVRELYGVMGARGVAGGFVVTSGRFTSEATTFAQGRNIQLVDGANLLRWMDEERSAGVPTMGPSTSMMKAGMQASSVTAPPSCPSCGGAMVLRQAKQGRHAGRNLWGCVQFPSCRGSRHKDEVSA
jgi:restriction system protein